MSGRRVDGGWGEGGTAVVKIVSHLLRLCEQSWALQFSSFNYQGVLLSSSNSNESRHDSFYITLAPVREGDYGGTNSRME